MIRQVEVAVVGAGQAGLAAVAEVRKAARDFVLIDSGGLGSTCARIGCRPARLAAHLAELVAQRHSLRACGIPETGSRGIDQIRVPALLWGAHEAVGDAPTADQAELPADALIQGEARFIGPNTLRAGGQTIKARAIVIATGAASEVPPHWCELLGDRLLTLESLFRQERLPASVAVIGLGSVGLELAQVLYRLGVQVIGIESRQTIAQLQDPFVNQLAVDLVGREFPLWRGAPALVEPRGDAVLVRAGAHQAVVERVLVAVGRHPYLKPLSLNQAGCALDSRGVPIHHPEHLRLGRQPIYIAGDAAGGAGGLRRAVEQGRVAGYNACHRTPIGYAAKTPLTVVYSEPNIARVGPPWSELDQSLLLTGQMGFGGRHPAMPLSQGRGLLRVYADRRDGRILGGAMIGPGCEHLAQVLAWGVAQRLSVQQMLQMPFHHPMVEEALHETLTELAQRLGPTPAPAPALGRLINWPGRSLRTLMSLGAARPGPRLGWCLAAAPEGVAGAGLGCPAD